MLRGLRGRVVAAMLLVSAVTLGVAAIALFSPLQTSLRDDELEGLVAAVRADRAAFTRLSERQLRQPSAALTATVKGLRRGTGADVAVLGPGGSILYATETDTDRGFVAARRALRSGIVQRSVVGSGTESEAQVGVPLTIDGTRIAVELRQPLDDVLRAVKVVRGAFLVAAGIGLVVALLVGLVLAGGLVRRLRALRDTALRVAELGPVAEMQDDAARDEVGDLTRALVTMQHNLREQEQARRTFVATASHELRTPLTSLRVMLDMLRADLESSAPDLADARVQAARADDQAERLSQLAAELLDLSRIDAGLPLRAELVETGEVVRSVVAEFVVRLGESDRTIDLRIDGAQWAVADPGSIAQIIRVLIDNALRHAPSSEPILVAVDEHGGRAVVTVADRGPGVPAADAERVFERFERGDTASAAPGFGLGLAIARELARRMGGDLVLAAPAGRGAQFELRLPAAPGGSRAQ